MLTMRFFMISSPLLIDLSGYSPKWSSRDGQKAKLSITLKFMEIKHFRLLHLPKFGTKIWAKSQYRGLNSLSQNLTVLPAPSGREPLAWRESFWLKGKAFCPGVPLPSCRFASSHLPQGDGFSSGGKLCGIAIRRPLGGAVAAGD